MCPSSDDILALPPVLRGPAASEASVDEQVAELARRYSERAEAYDRLWSPVLQPVARRLLGHLALAQATDVLDVGTGAGALLPLIRQAAPGARVLGIDNAEGMLRLARGRHSGLTRTRARSFALWPASLDRQGGREMTTWQIPGPLAVGWPMRTPNSAKIAARVLDDGRLRSAGNRHPGLAWTVEMTVGSTAPGWRAVTRRIVRHRMAFLHRWRQHNVEEVGNLPYFLPELYRGGG